MAATVKTIDTWAESATESSAGRFSHVRALSLALAENLSDADASVQSMPDASPVKWHLAHTTWFFETFVLAEFVPGYRLFDARFPFLYNSYYEAKGARIGRASRGLITRPSLDETRAYRLHVDDAVRSAIGLLPLEALELLTLGCHHEEQHQELLLTDLLNLFAQNPLAPAVWPSRGPRPLDVSRPVRWIEGREGPVNVGHAGRGFAFDCECPRHKTWLTPHAIADRVVTNGEWQAFIEDGGYVTVGNGWRTAGPGLDKMQSTRLSIGGETKVARGVNLDWTA